MLGHLVSLHSNLDGTTLEERSAFSLWLRRMIATLLRRA
jgi:hypothetical protein